MRVRVRLAPSPTGPLHVGTARTALFNYLFARQHKGQFLLRIEDTDRARSKPEYEQEILEGLKWLGLSWNEGPDVGGPHASYRQSERSPHYDAAIEKLLREGKAVEQAGAIMFHVTAAEPLVVHDLIRGDVKFPVTELADFIIAKSVSSGAGEGARRSLGSEAGWVPLFHLAVVVDDAAMGITHVIRGEDHLSNTPKHILLQRALGLPTPQYAHVPLLLDTERKKLSKRTLASGATLDVRLLGYRDTGYLPEAMVNFLALLGWNPKTSDEVFTLDELVQRFRLEGIQKAGAIFDLQKLEWLQRQHLQRLSLSALASRVTPYVERAGIHAADSERLARALELWRERGGALRGAPEELRCYFEDPRVDVRTLPWQGTSATDTRDALGWADELLQRLPETAWANREQLQQTFVEEVDRAGRDRGTVLWPLRYALSGRRESPGPGEIAWVLGKEETLRRLRYAASLLGT
ncbi:MAG: glutamyl-tRNA synthetase [Parcubacteria group bacterium Gr01-1014_38]|nr:MAG: glutamyl-tRNA synthetase [Parcubacteria group bacterium Gr01-1014_38]